MSLKKMLQEPHFTENDVFRTPLLWIIDVIVKRTTEGYLTFTLLGGGNQFNLLNKLS